VQGLALPVFGKSDACCNMRGREPASASVWAGAFEAKEGGQECQWIAAAAASPDRLFNLAFVHHTGRFTRDA
jgi:hypothetical protein